MSVTNLRTEGARPVDTVGDSTPTGHGATPPEIDPARAAIDAAFARDFREEESDVEWRTWVTIDPDVMVGKPTFKGTRLTVELVLENLGKGTTAKELLDTYPRLRPEHIRAACSFAADALRRRTSDPFADAE